MKKQYSTKKALIASLLALCMCFTMLIGTTFAWFTDSVSSDNNVIQTGKLKVGMYWANGAEAIPTAKEGWKNATSGPIFNSTKWEPGYSEAKHIKITNEGTLALKYQLRILANGIVSELADVIDVYYFSEAKQLTRNDFTTANKIGTLSSLLTNDPDGKGQMLAQKINGSIEAGKYNVVTLAFKMQESAGNEYQELSIGANFSVQIIATQAVSESDSFNNGYDNGAGFPAQTTPAATVSVLSQEEIEAITLLGYESSGIVLNSAYQFEPSETEEEVLNSKYRWYHADFAVSADRDVKAGSLMLAGYYSAYCDDLIFDLNIDGKWIAFETPSDVPANTEVRLLEGFANVAYKEIATYGNDGKGFRCGIADLDGSNAGTTVTVELRLYEVENADNDSGSHNVEVGPDKYITIGTFSYTFPNPKAEAVEVQGVQVELTSQAQNSIKYHSASAYSDKVQSIEVWSKEDLESALKLRQAGVFVYNGQNDIHPELIFMRDIDFGGDDFAGFGSQLYIYGNGHTLSNINFVPTDAVDGKAGLVAYAGNNIIKDLTIKDATATGCQAGIFSGNANNVQLVNCALEGNITVNWMDYTNPTTSYHETYNGVGAAIGVYADSVKNTVGVDVSNANIVINKTGITYPSGYAAESNNLVGVVYGGTYYLANVSEESTWVNNDAALSDAVATGSDEVVLGAGNYTMPLGTSLVGKELKVVGNGSTILDVSNVDANNQFVTGAELVFEGVTLEFGHNHYMGFANCESLVYRNCKISGLQFLYADNVVFENCVIDSTANTGEPHSVWTYGAENVSFVNCEFIYGNRAVNCYGDDDVTGGKQVVNFTNCKFTTTATNSKGGVEINSSRFSVGIEVNMEGCTAPSVGPMAYVSEWDTTNGAKTTINIK